jgi:hypothetical protein
VAEGLVEIGAQRARTCARSTHGGQKGWSPPKAVGRVSDERASKVDEVGPLMRRAVGAGEFRRYSDLNHRPRSLIREIAAHRAAGSRSRCCRAAPPPRSRTKITQFAGQIA